MWVCWRDSQAVLTRVSLELKQCLELVCTHAPWTSTWGSRRNGRGGHSGMGTAWCRKNPASRPRSIAASYRRWAPAADPATWRRGWSRSPAGRWGRTATPWLRQEGAAPALLPGCGRRLYRWPPTQAAACSALTSSLGRRRPWCSCPAVTCTAPPRRPGAPAWSQAWPSPARAGVTN